MNSSTEPSTLHESPVRRVDAGVSVEGTPQQPQQPRRSSLEGPPRGPLFSNTSLSDEVALLLDSQQAQPTARTNAPVAFPPVMSRHVGVPPLAGGGQVVPLSREEIMSPMSGVGGTDNSSFLRGEKTGALPMSNPPSASRQARRASSANRGLRSAVSTPRLGAAERAQQSFIAMKGAQLNAQRSVLESASKHRLQRAAQSQSFTGPSLTMSSSTLNKKSVATSRSARNPFAPVPASQFFAESSTPGGGANRPREPSFLAAMETASSHNVPQPSFQGHHAAAQQPQQLPSSATRRHSLWEDRPCCQCGGTVVPAFRRVHPRLRTGEGLSADGEEFVPITEFEWSMALKLQNLGRSLRRDLK